MTGWMIPAFVMRMLKATDKSGWRPAVSSLVVWPDGRVAASDGFLMVEGHTDAFEGLADHQVLLNAADLQLASKWAGQKTNAWLTREGESLFAYVGRVRTEVVAPVGDFPEPSTLRPKSERKACVALGPELLMKLAELAKGSQSIRLWLHEPNEAVEFEFSFEGKKDQVISGVLMPRYVEWGEPA